MNRCAYCKKQGAAKKTAVRFSNRGKLKTLELDYCSDDCKQNIHEFTQLHNKYAPSYQKFAIISLFLFAIIPFTLQALTGDPFWVNVVSPAMMALIGVVIIRFPFGLSTMKYYNRMGIKYTTLAIRLTGLLILITAADMLWGALK